MDTVGRLRWSWALLALLVVAAFANTLGNDWHFDDHHSILENGAIRSLGNTPSFFTDVSTFSGRTPETGMYRPLLLVGYAATYALGGYSLPLWHAVQILLHLLCVLVVHRLFRSLGASPPVAFLGAALFAVHPIQTQALNYLSSRSELQVSLFVGLSLVLSVEDHRVGSLLCLLLGLLTKSVAVVVPVLIVLWRLWLGPERDAPLREGVVGALRAVLPHLALVAAYLVLRKLIFGAVVAPVQGGEAVTGLRLFEDSPLEAARHGMHGRSVATNLLVQASVLWLYLRLIVVPWGLSICHDVDVSPSLLAWPTPAAVVGVLLLVGGLVLLRRRQPLVSFGGLFFLALVAPTSVVPLNLLANEHRVYLASAGLFLGAAAALEAVATRRSWDGRRLAVACGALLVACCVGSAMRNRTWSNDLSLWSDAAAKAPGGNFVRVEYATALSKAGLPEEALVQYELWNRQFHLQDVPALTNAALVCISRRYPHLARRYLEPILAVQDPDRPRALIAWAMLLVLAGRPERALQQMDSVAREYPGSPLVEPHRELIRTEVEGRRLALERARQALLAAGPDDESARFAWAAALDAAGHRDEALAEFSAGLQRWPASVPAQVALADLMGRDGRWAEAGQRALAALSLAPTNGRALELLACSQGALGKAAEGRETAKRLLELTGRVSAEVRWFVGLPPYGEEP